MAEKKKKRTIVKIARSMLKGKGLPNNLWVEVMNITIYVLNQSPNNNMTPYEAWYN